MTLEAKANASSIEDYLLARDAKTDRPDSAIPARRKLSYNLAHMANVCKVCRHRERDLIDSLCVTLESADTIGRKFALSHDAISNHRNKCIPEVVQAVRSVDRSRRAKGIFFQLDELRIRTERLLQDKKCSRADQIKLIQRREHQIELEGRLLGVFQSDRENDSDKAARDRAEMIAEARRGFIAKKITEIMADRSCGRLEAAQALAGMLQAVEAQPFILAEIESARAADLAIEISAKRVDGPADDQNAVELAILPKARPSESAELNLAALSSFPTQDDRSSIHQQAERRRVGAL